MYQIHVVVWIMPTVHIFQFTRTLFQVNSMEHFGLLQNIYFLNYNITFLNFNTIALNINECCCVIWYMKYIKYILKYVHLSSKIYIMFLSREHLVKTGVQGKSYTFISLFFFRSSCTCSKNFWKKFLGCWLSE